MMRSSKLRAFVLLAGCAAAMTTSALGQDTTGELGWVNRDGVHLDYGPGWRSILDKAGENARKAQQRYDRCRNPGSSISLGDVVRAIGDARNGRFDYRRYGQRSIPQRQRQDCGPPPVTNGANELTLVEADWSSGVPRTGSTLGRMAFRSTGVTTISTSAPTGGRCMALMDGSGALVPIRAARDPDPYTFANPFGGTGDPVAVAEREVQQLGAALEQARSRLASARSTLPTLASYRGGGCSMPAKRAYPAKPSALSDSEVETQAAGSCVDLMMRRHNPAKVMGALRSVRWDDMLVSMKRYQAKPQQCANLMQSQVNDAVIRMACAFTDLGCYGAMQQAISQCQAQVRSSCGAPMARWRQEVAAIDAEPERELRQCQSLLAGGETAASEIASLEVRLREAQTRLAAAKSAAGTDDALPISQSRCGS